jgi:fumarate hydratase subunit beta
MSQGHKRIRIPFEDPAEILSLRAGDSLLLSGVMYTARDAAHKRLIEALDRGEELPIPLPREVIYYVGPTPPKPGQVIGSAGPTTAYRVDPYAPRLIELGLGGMIGKGWRGQVVRDALVGKPCVYMAAIGGAGAYLAKRITAAEVVAYDDLGPEAIRRLTVEDFPVIVINDSEGTDFYDVAQAPYRKAGA